MSTGPPAKDQYKTLFGPVNISVYLELHVSVTKVQCTLQKEELDVYTNNGTRGQSIARLKLT
jgi:hypothetical protein